jgi:hypothetical protein
MTLLPQIVWVYGNEMGVTDQGEFPAQLPADMRFYAGNLLERRGIEPRFAECDSAVIPLDHRPGNIRPF